MKSNVWLRLLDAQGRAIEERRGHNVMTQEARGWLRDLVVWSTIATSGADDVPRTKRRVRWIAVGTGSQPTTPVVSAMVAPVLVSGADYLAALPIPTFATATGVKYVHTFGPSQLPNPVTVSEAGLFVDYHNGTSAGLASMVGTHPPAFYHVFGTPLTKNNTQSLVVEWHLRY